MNGCSRWPKGTSSHLFRSSWSPFQRGSLWYWTQYSRCRLKSMIFPCILCRSLPAPDSGRCSGLSVSTGLIQGGREMFGCLALSCSSISSILSICISIGCRSPFLLRGRDTTKVVVLDLFDAFWRRERGIVVPLLRRYVRGDVVNPCDRDRAGRGREADSGHALGPDCQSAATCCQIQYSLLISIISSV